MINLELTSNQIRLLRSATEKAHSTNMKQMIQGISNKKMRDDMRRLNKDLEELIKKLQARS